MTATNQKLSAIAVLSITLLLLGGCSRGPKDLAYVETGKKFLQKKDYPRAAIQFLNAVRVNPKNFEAQYNLAVAEIGLGDKVTAYRALTRALDLNPKDTGAQLLMSQLLLTSRSPEDLKQAQDYAKGVLEGSPDNPDALDAMATADLKLGDRDHALELLQRASTKAPEHLQTAIELSLLKLSKKDVAGAQKTLEEALAKAPDSVQGHLILGGFYLALGKLPPSEQQFRAAIQRDPSNSAALFYLAMVLRSAGRNGEAEELYRRVANGPTSPYQSAYATYLLRAGRQKEGVAELERLAKLNPKDTNARTRLITAYIATKRFTDAQQLLTTTLRKNPKDTQALFQKSELELMAGDYQDSSKDLNQILQFIPASARAHFLLASVERAQGRLLPQRQELAETLRLDPRFFAARIALAQSYILAGDGRNALDLMDHTPDDQRTLGFIEYRNWALLAAGKLKELRQGIAEGLAKGTTRDLLIQDALLDLREGDAAAGRARLLEILKRNPEDLGAVDLLIRSDAARKQLPAAMATVRMLIAERPKSAPLQYRLGAVLAAAHQTSEARAAYTAALQLDPQFSPGRLALAALDQAAGRPDAARHDLDPLLLSKSDEIPARTELGYIDAKSGDYLAAVEQLRKVVEAQPTNVVALNNLAYLLADRNVETDEALKYAQKAKELAPDNITVGGTLGWAYFQKGLYRSALSELKAAVAREGKTVTDGTAIRRYHLAMAYAKTGDAENAAKTLNSAFSLDPKLPESLVAAQMVGAEK